MKPMLAATIKDIDQLRYPLLASPKLDGIRALVKDGVVVSRKLRPIPNQWVQERFSHLEGFDGELICGEPTDPDVFSQTQSAVMRKKGPPVTFWVFDNYLCPEGFWRRYFSIQRTPVPSWCQILNHHQIDNLGQLLRFQKKALSEGYEGVMLRDPSGKYKFGRSTFKQHGLMKLKVFADAEAQIMGFEEQMENTNEATRDATGRIKRSSEKFGMVGKNTLGALKVIGVSAFRGVEFSVGSGFTDELRDEIWSNLPLYSGRIITFKYFPTDTERPRFPTFLRFRDENF